MLENDIGNKFISLLVQMDKFIAHYLHRIYNTLYNGFSTILTSAGLRTKIYDFKGNM